jgi:glutathionylspermidine synthase
MESAQAGVQLGRPPPMLDGRYPVLGSWIVGEESAGLGIRESETPITTNRSQFVPHLFR